MIVLGSFDYSFHTELAVTELTQRGINQNQILAVPLDEIKGEPRQLFDTIHHSDGVSMIDAGALLATACMTLGVIYGFVLEWGPIIWGLIGMLGGFISGCLLDYICGGKRHSKNQQKQRMGQLIVMIDCVPEQSEIVKNILWDHLAFGVAIIN